MGCWVKNENEHKCDRGWKQSAHDASFGHGEAVKYVIKKDGKWYVYNDEYVTHVKFCPFCGIDLRMLDWEEQSVDMQNSVEKCIGIVDKNL